MLKPDISADSLENRWANSFTGKQIVQWLHWKSYRPVVSLENIQVKVSLETNRSSASLQNRQAIGLTGNRQVRAASLENGQVRGFTGKQTG
jgi:hypothetical protein